MQMLNYVSYMKSNNFLDQRSLPSKINSNPVFPPSPKRWDKIDMKDEKTDMCEKNANKRHHKKR